MNQRYLLSATAGLALMLAGLFVPVMKHSVDTGLARNARSALASRGLSGITVRADWASLTLRGHASARTPALAAVHRMRDRGAVNTVTYVCTASCSGPRGRRVPAAAASPSRPSPSRPSPSRPSRPAPAAQAAPDRIEARIRQALGNDGVTFAAGSARLSPRARTALRRVAATLASAPGLTVTIAGYTDSSGDAWFNRALSLARASAARDYLAAHGVPAARLKTAGFGAGRPVADNSTAAGRAANRRIEFTVQGS